MDVELLSRMIAELVVDHDRVGLPGVGTFYTEVVPSTFSDRGYTINPPYRRLSFLPNALENDLLVNFYAEVNGIPAEVAREYLTQFLAELGEVLKERKSITLPGLGRLRATKENNFFFVPDENLDIYPEAFGLSAVSLKTLPTLDDEKVDIPFEFKAVRAKAAVRQESAAPVSVETPAHPAPAESAETSEQPEPAEPAEPETASVPAPAETASSADEPAVAEQADSTEQAEQTESSAPAETSKQPEPAEPATPVEPAAPVTAPSDPAESKSVESDQTEPTDLTDPTEQTDLTDPTDAPKPRRFRWWIPLLVLLAVAAVALAAFLLLAHAAPDFIDSILYTPEQLRIINY